MHEESRQIEINPRSEEAEQLMTHDRHRTLRYLLRDNPEATAFLDNLLENGSPDLINDFESIVEVIPLSTTPESCQALAEQVASSETLSETFEDVVKLIFPALEHSKNVESMSRDIEAIFTEAPTPGKLLAKVKDEYENLAELAGPNSDSQIVKSAASLLDIERLTPLLITLYRERYEAYSALKEENSGKK